MFPVENHRCNLKSFSLHSKKNCISLLCNSYYSLNGSRKRAKAKKRSQVFLKILFWALDLKRNPLEGEPTNGKSWSFGPTCELGRFSASHSRAGRLDPPVSDVTFFNHGGRLDPPVGDVTFFAPSWGPMSMTSRFLDKRRSVEHTGY